jgi:pilus assembly protein Flp/PilA
MRRAEAADCKYNMIRPTRDLFRRAAARQPAQGLAEYAFILAGVALAVVVAVFALGPQLNSFFNAVRNSIPG